MALFPKAGEWERDFVALNLKYWSIARDLAPSTSSTEVWQCLGIDRVLGTGVAAMPAGGVSVLASVQALMFRPRSTELAVSHARCLAHRGPQSLAAWANLTDTHQPLPAPVVDLARDYWRTVREFVRKDRVLGIAMCQVSPVLADLVSELDNAEIDKLSMSQAAQFAPRNPVLSARLVSLVSSNASPLAIARMHVSMLCAPSFLDEVA